MPKTWTAQEVRGISQVRFIVDGLGNVTGLNVIGEVNDGEKWMPLALDLWPDLTATQKTQMQALFTKLKTAYQQRILG